MSLTIYPLENNDSFITVADADTVITNNSIQSADWLALTEAVKEVYLRIAHTRILNAVSTDTENLDGYLSELTYVYADSCLPKSNAMMAVHDVVYGLSGEINPNMGLITKEKVGELEVTYYQGQSTRVNGRVTSPYPKSVVSCINSYGANVTSSGFKQVTLVTK